MRPSFSLLVLGVASRAAYLTSESQLFASYDYVVVGGGAAGAAVSSRLSERNGELPDSDHQIKEDLLDTSFFSDRPFD
jgi:hypothetical protein